MTAPDPLASMTPDELITVIERGLKADEEAARAATPGRWKLWAMQVRADIDGTGEVDTSLPVADTFHEDGLRTWNADHIARHDPERALADVESKREIAAACKAKIDYADEATDIDSYGALDLARETLERLARPYLDQETP